MKSEHHRQTQLTVDDVKRTAKLESAIHEALGELRTQMLCMRFELQKMQQATIYGQVYAAARTLLAGTAGWQGYAHNEAVGAIERYEQWENTPECGTMSDNLTQK